MFQHEYNHLKQLLCYDYFPPEDREVVWKSINFLMGLYLEDDAQTDIDPRRVERMRPRPLSARWMLLLESDTEGGDDNDAPQKNRRPD